MEKNKNRPRQYDTGKELKSFKIGDNVHVQLSKLNAKKWKETNDWLII